MNLPAAQIEEFAVALRRSAPSWITGSQSQYDTRFLFRTAYEAGADTAVEIGTASGFSTGALCHALHLASQEGRVSPDFQVISYDALPTFYADPSRRVGDAAREQLPPELLAHIAFRNPHTAADLGRFHQENEIELLFIDADHRHPWPTLDLYAALPYLRPGALVLMHDVNLPIISPQFPDWGVKFLFDSLVIEKWTPDHGVMPNIGCIRVPEDKADLELQLTEVLMAYEPEAMVDNEYLERLGLCYTVV